MRRKIMSVLLALSMVLALAPAAYAAELPEAVDGVITLDGDVELDATKTISDKTVLDLNGFEVSGTSSGDSLFVVAANATLTIKDSGGDGKITSALTNTIQVEDSAALVIENGTIENTNEDGRAINNMGTVTMNDGTISGFYCIRNKYMPNSGKIECTLNGGTVSIIAEQDKDGYGIGLFGAGLNHPLDNDLVVLNIHDGVTIEGTPLGNGEFQGIGTNASSGAFAGYTINMYGGTIKIDGTNGCGMYLPAVGEVNISGGLVRAEQAIRIAAGELNITGGTIEGTAPLDENTDLISGASGGTQGAIVVGKASSGYPGDLEVNISGSAVIKNTATGGDDDVKPAIVVSDKNMANTNNNSYKELGSDGKATTGTGTYQFSETTISVDVKDVVIEGDIVKTSDITGSGTQDGGNTNLNLEGTKVTGNVINQTKEGSLDISNAEVSGALKVTGTSASAIVSGSTVGSVVNGGTGNVIVMNSDLGTPPTGNNVVMVGSTVDGAPEQNTSDVVAINGAKTYDNLATALNEANSKDTVLLVDDATLTTAVGNGVVLDVLKGVNLTIDSTKITDVMDSQGTIRVEAGAFLDLGSSLKMIGDENYNINLKTGVVDMKMDLSKGAINLDFKGASAEVPAGKVWTTSMSSLVAGAKVNPSLDEGSVLTVNGTRFQVANGSTMDNEGTIVVNSLMIISSKGEVTGDGTINVARGGKLEIKKGTATVGDFAGNVNNSGIVAYDGTGSDKPTGTIAMGSGGVVYSQSDISSQLTGRIKALGSNLSYAPYDVDKQDVGELVTYANAWSYKKSSSSSSSSSGSSATEEEYKITVEDVENGTVKTSPKEAAAGDEVTITVNPDSGYVLDKIRVEDKDGDKVKLTEGEDGKYTFEMPEGGVTISVTFAEETAEEEEETVESVNPFVDVLETAYYYKAVLWAVENGVTSGTSEITFSPSMPCDRGQMATFLWNLAGRPAASGSNPFVDVTADQYYYTAVLWAVDQGITSGTSDNTFSPAKPCSRAEMATFLWNMAGRPAATGSNPFVDVTTSDYYYNAVLWAAETGVTAGTGSNTFSPAQTCSRGEMATFLYNYAS